MNTAGSVPASPVLVSRTEGRVGWGYKNGICLPRLPGNMLENVIVLDSEKRQNGVGGPQGLSPV